ncbi:WcaF family extracellular polysaccharide biosynthesis acetyltransferase [Roseiconus lacunae]|uniref:WcaF family extracellular polysaccharide biosynthesis acetyltransferase n=1 Tax=Roseiconus lacunae TaxID=2605694 RepID=UPI00308D2D48|nr:WcaF family extracellular polysaccharide biosynthesis acetyltransferase [Stieleria sp. HD01]
MLASESKVRLDQFDAQQGLDRGASRLTEMAWYLVKCMLFLSPLPWPGSWKCKLLRLFGAKIGRGVVIKPRVNIHFPWKLTLGDHSWIGEEVFILNFEPIEIGDHACVSQRAFLCGGNHDFRDPTFTYRNAPIKIGKGVWIGAQSFVGPGVTVDDYSVVVAGSIVSTNLPSASICRGNPCQPIKPRWPSTSGGE